MVVTDIKLNVSGREARGYNIELHLLGTPGGKWNITVIWNLGK
jgi:hypothetical protein